jgi:hypothetical protein
MMPHSLEDEVFLLKKKLKNVYSENFRTRIDFARGKSKTNNYHIGGQASRGGHKVREAIL